MDILIMAGQLIFALLILVGLHEAGHMLTAKWFGMRVSKFFIGFPPTVYSKQVGETEYGLGAIPLGGFVKIEGMVDESLDLQNLSTEPEPWEFRAKPAWQRLIVMLGGIIVNFFLGIFIFIGLLYVNGEHYLPASEVKFGIVAHELGQEMGLKTGDKILKVNGKTIEKFDETLAPDVLLGSNSYYTVERGGQLLEIRIPTDLLEKLSDRKARKRLFSPAAPFEVEKIMAGMPAEKAGLQIGDKIMGINDKGTRYFQELQDVLKLFKDQDVTVHVQRGENLIHLPIHITKEGLIGFKPKLLLKEGTIQYSFLDCIPAGTGMAFEILELNISGFGKIFKGEVSASNAVSGPIGIAQDMFGSSFDWTNFWRNTGMLSLILAFMNLLPIPALDGGHVVFLLYEMVSRRKPSLKFMEWSQKIGMLIVLSLMVFAIFNDVFKRLF
jgi:regulator of sigma E protease